MGQFEWGRVVRIVVLLAGLLIGTGCTSTAEWGEWVPFDSAAPELAGVWESPATGHVVSFSREGRKVFHVLSPLCVQDNGVVPEYSLYRLSDRGALGLHYFDYRAHPILLQDPRIFEPRVGLPAGCLTSDDHVAPADLVRDIISAFDSFYAFFDRRAVDWERQKRLLFLDMEPIETDSMAFAALSDALSPLNDAM